MKKKLYQHKPVAINPDRDLWLIDPEDARTILDIHDGDTDIPQCSFPYVDHPDFAMWIIPRNHRAVMKACIDDYIGDYEPMDKDDKPPTRAEAREAIEDYRSLGYVALVGNVMTSMVIGSACDHWGKGHGIGTQIIRWLQHEHAKSGLFALNVTGGRRMLDACGFQVVPLPLTQQNSEYQHRPYMAWNMSDKQIAKTMKRYDISWSQL